MRWVENDIIGVTCSLYGCIFISWHHAENGIIRRWHHSKMTSLIKMTSFTMCQNSKMTSFIQFNRIIHGFSRAEFLPHERNNGSFEIENHLLSQYTLHSVKMSTSFPILSSHLWRKYVTCETVQFAHILLSPTLFIATSVTIFRSVCGCVCVCGCVYMCGCMGLSGYGCVSKAVGALDTTVFDPSFLSPAFPPLHVAIQDFYQWTHLILCNAQPDLCACVHPAVSFYSYIHSKYKHSI